MIVTKRSNTVKVEGLIEALCLSPKIEETQKKKDEKKEYRVMKTEKIEKIRKKPKFEKKEWGYWLNNWAVMDKAFKIWSLEVFAIKHTYEYRCTQKYKYETIHAWDLLPAEEKAPFITQALNLILPEIRPQWGRKKKSKKAVEETEEETKERKELEEYNGFGVYVRNVYFKDHFLKHPEGSKVTMELLREVNNAWDSLAESEKAKYVAEFKKRAVDLEELLEYLSMLREENSMRGKAKGC